jgi:hypothetical protein
MGMDLLRSCYETDMNFYSDTDAHPQRVRWFFCDAAAKIFPEPHLFGSGNWASDDGAWKGPGEIQDVPRPWADGAGFVGLRGQKFCGPLAAYQQGSQYPGVPLTGNVAGVPCCCDCHCECQALFHLLPDVVRVRITRVYAPGSPPVGHVGDVFQFAKNDVGGNVTFDRGFISSLNPYFVPIKWQILCFFFVGLGDVATLGTATFPSTVNTDWLPWSIDSCDPFAATILGYFVGNVGTPLQESWDLLLEKG